MTIQINEAFTNLFWHIFGSIPQATPNQLYLKPAHTVYASSYLSFRDYFGSQHMFAYTEDTFSGRTDSQDMQMQL